MSDNSYFSITRLIETINRGDYTSQGDLQLKLRAKKDMDVKLINI